MFVVKFIVNQDCDFISVRVGHPETQDPLWR